MADQTSILQACANSPAAFRNVYRVDANGVSRPLGEVMDPWQRERFEAADTALMRCAGRSNDATAKMRIYDERPRGHSKTTDLGAMTTWALTFATRPLRCYAFAADRDQAGLLLDAIDRGIRHNAWLGNALSVQKNAVVNVNPNLPAFGSRLDVFTSDVASSYGILPDLIIADELCHWEGDGGLWHSILSSAGKRSTCLLEIISNAGFTESWQWPVRETARTDPAWIFHRLEGPQASWMEEATFAEQRRFLPAQVYARLFENVWSAGSGDALNLADIERCETLKGPAGPRPDWAFLAGLDLGIKNDHSALVVLGVNRAEGRVELANVVSWRPKDYGGTVDLEVVRMAVLRAHQIYDFRCCGFDPWQAWHMSQCLLGEGVPMREWPFTSENKDLSARAVVEAFTNGTIALYPHPALKRDLLRLRVKESPAGGLRLDAVRDAEGHADTAIALSIILPAALYLAREARVCEPTPELLIA